MFRLSTVTTKSLALLVASAAALLAPPVAATQARSSSAPSVAPQRPNIVFILTDDQDKSLLRYMPNTRAYIRDQGAVFTNYFANTSLCCVARASILRGQYAHNTHVEDNMPPLGGFLKYHQVGNDTDDLPIWMQQAGYQTAFMGKYLNGYPNVKTAGPYYGQGVGDLDIPQGWDDWWSPMGGKPYLQYNYSINDNGTQVDYTKSRASYLTDVLGGKAVDYIDAQQARKTPFMMYVAPYSPHSPYTEPARYRYLEKDTSIRVPRTKAFNEAKVTDKPGPIATIPKLSKAEVAQLDHIYRKRVGSVRAIDDMVGDIYQSLRRTGQLDNTYIVFSSDNGFHLGDHRLPPGKYTPYETDIRLDLLIRGPGIAPGLTTASLAGNIDLAPTFLDMAGATIPALVDGESLMPWALGQAGVEESRKYFLLERKSSAFQGTAPTKAAATIEEPQDVGLSTRRRSESDQFTALPFYGVRSRSGYTYVRYASGEEEFYDLHADPFEVQNLLRPEQPPTLTATQLEELGTLRAVLPDLLTCAGAQCRSVDR